MESVKERLGKVAITVDKNYWSIDKAYDRLVIVEVKGEFRTYISRKPVPAGTMLNDREYWIPFSSLKEEFTTEYNAWLNKYSSILDVATNRITTSEFWSSIALLAKFRPNAKVILLRVINGAVSGESQYGDTLDAPTLDIFRIITKDFNVLSSEESTTIDGKAAIVKIYGIVSDEPETAIWNVTFTPNTGYNIVSNFRWGDDDTIVDTVASGTHLTSVSYHLEVNNWAVINVECSKNE